MVLDFSLLNTQQYKVRIKGKVKQSWERSSALPLHLRCSSYWKGSLLVALDYNRQFYLLVYTYIVFYKCPHGSLSRTLSMSVYLLVCFSVCLSVSLSVCLSVCLSICLSVSSCACYFSPAGYCSVNETNICNEERKQWKLNKHYCLLTLHLNKSHRQWLW